MSSTRMSQARSTPTAPPRPPGEATRGPAAGEADPVVVLTDEELLALHEDHRRIVVLPHADQLSESDLRVARDTALRGLVARGWARPAHRRGAGAGPAEPPLAEASLAALLVVRDNAETALAVRRTVGGRAAHRYLHLSQDVCLVEDVTGDGLHWFRVVDLGDVGPVMQAYLAPPEARDGAQALVVDPHLLLAGQSPDPALRAALEVLDRSATHADLVVRRVGDRCGGEGPSPVLWGLFLGQAGCYRVEARPGDKGPLHLLPMPSAGVGDWVAALLVPASGRPPGRGTMPG